LTVKRVYVSAHNRRVWSTRWDAEYKCDASVSPQFSGVLSAVWNRLSLPFHRKCRLLFLSCLYGTSSNQ
jgi:hypothetical protein